MRLSARYSPPVGGARPNADHRCSAMWCGAARYRFATSRKHRHQKLRQRATCGDDARGGLAKHRERVHCPCSGRARSCNRAGRHAVRRRATRARRSRLASRSRTAARPPPPAWCSGRCSCGRRSAVLGLIGVAVEHRQRQRPARGSRRHASRRPASRVTASLARRREQRVGGDPAAGGGWRSYHCSSRASPRWRVAQRRSSTSRDVPSPRWLMTSTRERWASRTSSGRTT